MLPPPPVQRPKIRTSFLALHTRSYGNYGNLRLLTALGGSGRGGAGVGRALCACVSVSHSRLEEVHCARHTLLVRLEVSSIANCNEKQQNVFFFSLCWTRMRFDVGAIS